MVFAKAIRNQDHVRNDEVRWTTGEPYHSAIVHTKHDISPCSAILLECQTTCQEDLTDPLENWRKPPVRHHTTWMKTTQQDLKSYNRCLNEAIDMAHNHPLWRMMSMFGAMHS